MYKITTPFHMVYLRNGDGSSDKSQQNGSVYVTAAQLPKTHGGRDYVVDIGCWLIDLFFKTITCFIGGVIMMMAGAIVFVAQLMFWIVMGVAGFCMTCWVLGFICKVAWMIWGPRNI